MEFFRTEANCKAEGNKFGKSKPAGGFLSGNAKEVGWNERIFFRRSEERKEGKQEAGAVCRINGAHFNLQTSKNRKGKRRRCVKFYRKREQVLLSGGFFTEEPKKAQGRFPLMRRIYAR